jgi:hypothetical protein
VQLMDGKFVLELIDFPQPALIDGGRSDVGVGQDKKLFHVSVSGV